MRVPRKADRRTVLKALGVSTVGSWAVSGSARADKDHGGQPAATPPFWTPTWGSDETDEWEIVDVSGDVERETTEPYTLIPKTGIGRPGPFGNDFHFPFHHDQVVPTPPQNKGSYNANWHTHNVFYTGGGDHHNRPYNGKEVLTNSYEIVKDSYDFFLGKKEPPEVRDPNFVEVMPNDASGRGDEYLNTSSQIENATNGKSVGEPGEVPEESGSGDTLFPTDEKALPNGATYGQIFGEGFFVAFTFVCPVRPADTGQGNN